MLHRIAVLLILVFPNFLEAQTYVAGYGGTLDRVQADRFDFSTFRSAPISMVSPLFGAGGGTAIWKVRVDGTLLWSTTGEKDVFVGPTREIEQTARGSSLMLEGGGGWPLLKLFGFQAIARAGYGLARVRVPTEIPIEDRRSFWTYGIAATRPLKSRYLLRIDVRNVYFRREEIPQTLGRFNIVAMAGFGLKF